MTKISPHFSDYEVFSPELLELINDKSVPASWYITKNQINLLERLRNHFGKPVYVNLANHKRRGICTEQECIDADRSLLSQHIRSGAFDITIKDTSPSIVGEFIRSIAHEYGIGGMGINVAHDFCHTDFRQSDTLVEWTY